MDSSEQLKQLLSEDLPSLGAYYRDISGEEGSGMLVVNYYPSGEVAQMSAKFLKPNQIGRLARQMGLPTLQFEFSQHNQQKQMVVALVTAQTKGVVTVELHELEVHPAPVQAPESQGKLRAHLHQSAKGLQKQQHGANLLIQQSSNPKKISHKLKHQKLKAGHQQSR